MKKALLAAAVVFAASASMAQAQVAQPFSFGVSAGAAIPTGKTSDAANTGFDITGMTEYRAPALPMTLRGELTYNRFGMKGLPDGISGHHSILGGVVSAIAPFAATPALKPYVIGGLGVYNVKSTASDGDVSMTASIGSAATLDGGLDEVLRYAAVAMYAAKRSGRGQHRAFEMGMLERR